MFIDGEALGCLRYGELEGLHGVPVEGNARAGAGSVTDGEAGLRTYCGGEANSIVEAGFWQGGGVEGGRGVRVPNVDEIVNGQG